MSVGDQDFKSGMSGIHSCNQGVIDALEAENNRLRAEVERAKEEGGLHWARAHKFKLQRDAWKAKAELNEKLLKITENQVANLHGLAERYEKALREIADRKIKWENTLTMELQGIAKAALAPEGEKA